MYISIPILILICIVLAWYYESDADKLIAEMRDPGGIKRQAAIDAKAADKAARKAARKLARGPGRAILGGIALVGAVIGGSWLLWGGTGAMWAAWFVAGPFIVGPAMLALRHWPASFTGLRVVFMMLGVALVPFTIAGIKCLLAVLR